MERSFSQSTHGVNDKLWPSSCFTNNYSNIDNCFYVFKKIPLKGNKVSIFDKSWITCLIVLMTSQMYDVQYFDGRISIFLWILISGSTNIIKE